MTISSAMTVAAVQPVHNPGPPQAHILREPPLLGPAKADNRPVQTEILPTQPVAMPPVVTALTADFEAGRAAAEAARAAYLAERRQSQG
ncbi:hypothetical protein [Tabrizicola sp.]|uniref:hypothetical protein n=1 Tax=Tabrizicola sp. TaxID=2005166 RepID=UPI003D2C4223